MRFTFISMVAASLAVAVQAASIYARRAAEFALALIAAAVPVNWRMSTKRALVVDGPPAAYSAPTPHFLRHEAGIPRRGANRHT